jgi:Flp pilus assembly pilin Flp
MFDRFNAWVGSLYVQSHDLKNEDGQTFVEYALVLAVISVAILLAVMTTGLGTAVAEAIGDVANRLTGADPA